MLSWLCIACMGLFAYSKDEIRDKEKIISSVSSD